jgi:hypothetical protein
MSLGDFFGSLAGKALNATNVGRNLYCRTCKKSKPHTPLSYGEAARYTSSNETEANIGEAFGRALDYIPLTTPVLYGNSYFCNDCNRITLEGGLLSGHTKMSQEAYYYRP